MKRISVALCSALVLGLAAFGSAQAQEAQGHDDDFDKCPAKSWWACDDAGGDKFFKHDGKKFCLIKGDVKRLKCEYGFKAIGQKNILWVFTRGHDKWNKRDSCKKFDDLKILKCWKWEHWGWKPVYDDDECEDKCKLVKW